MEKKAMKCIPLHDYRPKLKSVFLDRLHTTYYCKRNIVDFLQQVEGKTGLAELKQLISSYIITTQQQLCELNALYERLNTQPEEIFVTGFKAYSLEALIAVLKQQKDPFKNELTLLNHLQSICAIDINNDKLLYQMSESLDMVRVDFLSMAVSNKVVLKSLERITGTLI